MKFRTRSKFVKILALKSSQFCTAAAFLHFRGLFEYDIFEILIFIIFYLLFSLAKSAKMYYNVLIIGNYAYFYGKQVIFI